MVVILIGVIALLLMIVVLLLSHVVLDVIVEWDLENSIHELHLANKLGSLEALEVMLKENQL